ncbi:MAG: cytochrome c-550 PedF [Campylobacteraceae bacterium]|nr:cytochrome c-550 PedF [Campylobacteraceae bacterium]
MKSINKITISLLACITLALSHGNVTPQAVETKGLKTIDQNSIVNPFRENKRAIEIGKSAYNSNCARCHGLDAISGGIAPDLRELTADDDELDEYFIGIVKGGVVRNGNVYMPPFKAVLSAEAIWSIRSWLATRPAD